MNIKIALAGNPNCGKTTLYNAITGSTEYVGNRPGVTVEEKEAKLKWNKEVIIMDLPGIYSLSPYTSEEVISREYIIEKTPDVILNVVDGSNIERNLYLTTQLIETGIPVVIGLNMMDIVNKSGDVIDISKLEKTLDCPVIPISALKGTGLKEVCEKAVKMAESKKTSNIKIFSNKIENYISQTKELIKDIDFTISKKWFAVKIFENDEEIIKTLNLNNNKKSILDNIISSAEKDFDDDTESIITNERYTFIEKTVASAVKKGSKEKLSFSDKIDKIVTNRIAALPIFAVVMFIVYYISVTSIGSDLTDWANDGVFGDGWHLPFTTEKYNESVENFENAQLKIDTFKSAALENGIDTEAFEEQMEAEEPDISVINEFIEKTKYIKAEPIDNNAFTTAVKEKDFPKINIFVAAAEANEIPADVFKEEIESENPNQEIINSFIADTKDIVSEEVDNFAFVEALEIEEPNPEEFGIWVPGIPVLAESALDSINASEWVKSLVLDGIIGGVGAVLGFVPQILILFFLLAILEDCGYMARIAFILDRIFRKFGLSGKSFIPVIVGTGCGVPGIMASRTIENNNDRRLTIMTTTFIPCGAKLPIIALIAGALFKNAGWVAPSAYFLGIFAIIFSGIVLKRLQAFKGDPAPFVMELPAYHFPAVKGLFIHMWDKGKAFIKKAGTIIFLACAVIWFLQSFNLNLEMVENAEDSMLASLGKIIAPLFKPLGFGNWEASVATVTGLVAKENVVGTFGVLYGVEDVAENGVEYWAMLREAFTPVTAYAFLAFNLLCAPCFAAIGAIRREMASFKWTVFAIIYQTLLAYVAALLINLWGTAIWLNGSFAAPIILTIIIIGFILFIFINSSKKTVPITA